MGLEKETEIQGGRLTYEVRKYVFARDAELN